METGKAGYESVPKMEGEKVKAKVPPKKFGVRHVQILLLFISLTIGYSMRAQLSVSLVSMTSDVLPKHTRLECHTKPDNYSVSMRSSAGDNFSEIFNYTQTECWEVPSNLSNWNVYRTYNWKKSTQEMILFAFFAGYTGMMIPMGLLSQKLGGKLLIVIALGANAVLSIITPWLPIWFNWPALCVCRLLQGMTQAAFYPSMHTMLARWSPLCERGRLSSYIYAGSQSGTILAFLLAGEFAGSPSLRWPATFWTLGLASLVCCCMLAWLGAASPHEHPSISDEELTFITQDGTVDLVPKKRKIPWMHILSSPAVWSIIIAQIGSNFAYLLVLTQMPMYMNKVLGVDIKRNGLFSSLPYIAMYFAGILFGYLTDIAANRKYMSIANIRRVANTIGLTLSGLFLCAFSYTTNTTLAVVLLILCIGTHSGIHVGFHINQIDIAPNFAGPVMALGNMLGNLSSLLVPVLVSNIVSDDVTNQSKWQTVFLVATLVEIAANTVFIIFVQGTVQPWNFYGEEGNDQEKKEMISVKEETILITAVVNSSLAVNTQTAETNVQKEETHA